VHRIPTLALACSLILVAAAAAQTPPAEAGDDDYARRMEHAHHDDTATPSPEATIAPSRPVSGEEVVYWSRDGKEIRGYTARPAGVEGPLPGVVVVQEWWGLNDSVRAMARRIAGEGYVTLAVDLYEGKVAETPEQAGASMRIAMARPERLSDNLAAGWRWLHDEAKAPKIGVVGWCFGGGWALQAALDRGEGMDAAVMYYGRPNLDAAELARLRAPLLGLFGGADEGIPERAVREMETMLRDLGKKVEIHFYPGAGHAFANPTGTNYQEAAASDAWRRTVAFFAAHLGG